MHGGREVEWIRQAAESVDCPRREWQKGRVNGAETAFGCESERDSNVVYHTPWNAKSDAWNELSPQDPHSQSSVSLFVPLRGIWPREREPNTDDDNKGWYWEWKRRDMQ